jgi:sporulation protein YlmC with PRC-barrel domain
MQFKQNASVYTADGKDAGRVDRVVLDPTTKTVTHLVIRKGFLFTEDKVVPIELLEETHEKGIRLRAEVSDLNTLPLFEEKRYVQAAETEPPPLEVEFRPPGLYPAPMNAAPTLATSPVASTYVMATEQNIPEGTVALKEGARVTTADGKNVGTLEQVLTDPGQDRAAYLIIAQGLLMKERRRIPSTWVSQITEDEIFLSVGAHTIEELGFIPA